MTEELLKIFEKGTVVDVKNLLERLQEKGVAIKDFDFPLAHAACNPNPEVAKMLISAGVNVNASYDDLTPLHIAVVRSNPEVAKVLISAGADVNARGKGFTPLHLAANKGKMELVKLLVSAGANANAQCNKHGVTPLHYVAADGNIDLVEVLISAGADPNVRDKGGSTPIDDAKEKGHTMVVQYLSSIS